jgi:prepilin-type N-terminal cleavage/methylation domain-containing protein
VERQTVMQGQVEERAVEQTALTATATAAEPAATMATPSGRVCGSPRARSPRSGGFTLIEILIAMVVLAVGLLGILAVFPHAMRSAMITVEYSYAAAISQSVMDAIHLGLREMRTTDENGRWLAFILDHSGPEELEADRNNFLKDINLADLMQSDGSPTGEFKKLLQKDYCILLPRADETVSSGSGTPVGKAFLYPRENKNDNLNRKGERTPTITKVYKLGQDLANSTASDPATKDLEQSDPLQTYAYAFTIRGARAPSLANPTPDRTKQNVAEGLCEVVVKIFRNFTEVEGSRLNKPYAEFVTYLGAR